jgi:hypothetical protein
MKKLVLTLTLVLFSSALYAQEDSHMQAVNELVDVMHMEQQMNESAERMFEMQAKQMPQIKQYEDVMMEFFNKYITWEKIGDQVKQVYKNNFSEQQLRELIDFMETDTGQAFAKKSPTVMQEVASISQGIVMEHQQELTQKMMEAMQDQ